jgi:hypothetical protein
MSGQEIFDHLSNHSPSTSTVETERVLSNLMIFSTLFVSLFGMRAKKLSFDPSKRPTCPFIVTSDEPWPVLKENGDPRYWNP